MCHIPCGHLFHPYMGNLVIARLAMHHGTVLGDGNKKPVPQNSPVTHCHRRYSQASSPTSEWRIEALGLGINVCRSHSGQSYV